MRSPPSRSVFGSPVIRQTYWQFLGRQFCRPWIYLLFLVSLAMYLLYEWRSWIRNHIYWDIR
jgi:hypothetical protein